MRDEKHGRNKFQIIEKYSVLILVATLFMSLGYAQITDTKLSIAGDVTSAAQDGVFITEISNVSNVNADTENSKINYFIGTMMDSKVVLGSTADSSITYEVTVYNSTEKEQVFIDVITDKTDATLYSNTNIGYSLSNIEKYVTTIAPNDSITFNVTFKYENSTDLTNNTLISKLNFRFQELPKLVLSNEGSKYELTNVYPGYTPHEYTFTVSNYDASEINTVPLKYTFTTTIDSPLTAKIYDSTGTEVTDSISLVGDGTSKVDNTYTLKIFWEGSPASLEYINTNFNCSVSLKALPDSDKYLNYQMTKEFSANIKSATFDFDAQATASTISMYNQEATLELILKNYNTSNSSEFNVYDTNYEVSLKDSSQFAVSITSGGKTITGGSAQDHKITLKINQIGNAGLDTEKTIVVKVKSTNPYVKEKEISITLNRTLMLADLIYDGLAGNYLTQTYTVDDSTGTTITVPGGFKATDVTYYVSDGVVMQDQKGNQFVWVPANGTNVSYAKWSTFDNPHLPIESTSDDTLPTGVSSENDQITKYKGFWVGRFEAGRSNVDIASADTNNSTSIELLIKQGAQPWNFITYGNAKIVAESYVSNSYVQSGLLTGTQLDTIAQWAKNDGKDVTTDGSSWGMLANTIGLTLNGRYSISDGIAPAGPQTWTTGEYVKSSQSAIFTGTGLNTNSQFKNIYDLVGNLWEWTTEVYDQNDTRIMRGSHAGSTGSILSYWEGNRQSLAMYTLGFRVVLYLK